MKLIHLLALIAIVGFVIVCAVSMNDWTPKNLSGFQRGEDQNNRVHIPGESLSPPPGYTPPIITSEKNAPPVFTPEVKALPTIKPEVKAKLTPTAEVPPAKKVDTDGLVLPPQPDDPILAWQYETTVMDYLRIGNRNKKWDQAAVDALYALARHFSTAHDVMPNEVLSACEKAIQLGSSDPLINYGKDMMSIKINGVYMKEDAEMIYRRGAFLHHSKYNPIRRCYGLIRGLPWLQRIDPDLKNATIRTMYVTGTGWALQDLEEALKDKEVPLEKLYENCMDIISLYLVLDKDRLKSFERVKTLLDKHCSRSSLIPAVIGRFYIDYGWDARGSDFASKVTSEGWKLLAERLALAKKYLDEAYTMDEQAPSAISNMITVCMGQSAENREVDFWFDRGVKSNPNHKGIYDAKMYYLQPRWHGSREEVIAFGRECVTRAQAVDQKNKEIGLTLVDAHEILADDYRRHLNRPEEEYWTVPGVWPDVKLVYETLLKFYPQGVLFRANYARLACLAKQWKTANEQFEILGKECPPGPFEGEAKMNSMRLEAAAKDK